MSPLPWVRSTPSREGSGSLMYLATQRVRDGFNREGINAFRYAHGYTWQLPPPGIPDDDSGVLVNMKIRPSAWLRWCHDVDEVVKRRGLPASLPG